MANSITHVAALIILISFLSISESDPITGFTTDLIHRDSPQSPSYDPSLTPSQRIANAIRRSLHRVQRRYPSKSRSQQKSPPPLSELYNSGGEYLMKYSLGSPPVPSLGIADTGSDIIWTQCQPCLQCFNQTLPIFDPKRSSTYKKIRCSAPVCGSTRQFSCTRGDRCRYGESYGDGSFTEGDLSRDTVTFPAAGGKSVVSVPKVVVGCGTNNAGIFLGGESGIVGLGGGKLSLVSQLGPLAGGKFSYCLVPFSSPSTNSSSKLSFGANAVVSGAGAVSTPLLRDPRTQTYYEATMLGISVGDRRFDFYGDDNGGGKEGGTIVVDSGSTLTYLPSGLYEKMKEALRRSVELREVADPTGVALGLCFGALEGDRVKIPEITVHFEGADLKWGLENVLVRVSSDAVCFAAKEATQIAIYGSFAQANFHVGFDTVKRTVSFKPTDCARL